MFHRRNFIFLEMLDGSGGMLAEQGQLDTRNHVRVDAFFDDTYAHVRSDGAIRRYGKTIGTIADLVIVR